MPKAKQVENVAQLTSYVDEQQRLSIVVARSLAGLVRAFAVSPENRGPQTWERAQRAATASATSWAHERGAASVEWQAPKCLPLADGRDIATAMEMVRCGVT